LKGNPVEMIGIGKAGSFALAIGKIVTFNMQDEEEEVEEIKES
jgi:hypothetical protein